ncbi:PilW family protein [Cupriavidus sp. AU9028]|uniref:PilW family protein n=1 Tax=Cupriavidus sp. AU9028 TaxID=2871157 RepID=UPI001C971357|nr:PilW family protein [Cupriavidus sp. AU9028]MBY4898165.1 PilW family protein [Cupriavidus sp. AU9028]
MTQRGATLVELLVGMALGAIVATGATVALRAVLAAYRHAVADVQLDQQGRAALDAIAHLVRHAGWRPGGIGAWPHAQAVPVPLQGRDDCARPSSTGGLHCAGPGLGASDALLVRFGGPASAAAQALPDRYLTDCSGFPVQPGAIADYAVANLLYLGAGLDGEPQLLCRYPGRPEGAPGASQAGATAGWATAVLARGVETLQFRFGVDRDGDGMVDAFVRADAIADEAGWRQVLAVRVALVLRAANGNRTADRSSTAIALMPPLLPGEENADTVFRPPMQPARLRRVFATTVQLRNPTPPCPGQRC